jgi:hypothetical protein
MSHSVQGRRRGAGRVSGAGVGGVSGVNATGMLMDGGGRILRTRGRRESTTQMPTYLPGGLRRECEDPLELRAEPLRDGRWQHAEQRAAPDANRPAPDLLSLVGLPVAESLR